jgi:hypothetical protein
MVDVQIDYWDGVSRSRLTLTWLRSWWSHDGLALARHARRSARCRAVIGQSASGFLGHRRPPRRFFCSGYEHE